MHEKTIWAILLSSRRITLDIDKMDNYYMYFILCLSLSTFYIPQPITHLLAAPDAGSGFEGDVGDETLSFLFSPNDVSPAEIPLTTASLARPSLAVIPAPTLGASKSTVSSSCSLSSLPVRSIGTLRP